MTGDKPQIWILEASQGTYSDRYDWVVNLYDSSESALNDPLNSKLEFVPEPPLRKPPPDEQARVQEILDDSPFVETPLGYHAVLEDQENEYGYTEDPIRYRLYPMEVLSYPATRPR